MTLNKQREPSPSRPFVLISTYYPHTTLAPDDMEVHTYIYMSSLPTLSEAHRKFVGELTLHSLRRRSNQNLL